jgi:hypothetical protein
MMDQVTKELTEILTEAGIAENHMDKYGQAARQIEALCEIAWQSNRIAIALESANTTLNRRFAEAKQ